jgi:hypothetical protein
MHILNSHESALDLAVLRERERALAFFQAFMRCG